MEPSTSKVTVSEPLKGMWVSSYITVTKTDEGLVRYGSFPSLEEAHLWAAQLDNAEIVPLYYPAYNRG